MERMKRLLSRGHDLEKREKGGLQRLENCF